MPDAELLEMKGLEEASRGGHPATWNVRTRRGLDRGAGAPLPERCAGLYELLRGGLGGFRGTRLIVANDHR
jgi:hypothetical protein